jgi:hypothetical protein
VDTGAPSCVCVCVCMPPSAVARSPIAPTHIALGRSRGAGAARVGGDRNNPDISQSRVWPPLRRRRHSMPVPYIVPMQRVTDRRTPRRGGPQGQSSGTWRSPSVLPEPIEAVGAHLGISHRVHDVAVAEEVLQCAGIYPVIGELETATSCSTGLAP